MKLIRVALALLVVAAAVTAASAQNGGLKVKVTDKKDNSALPGAIVELSHATGNIKAESVLTDADGFAIFPVLRAGGGYIVKVTFPGFAPIVLSEQRVGIGETKLIAVGMSEQIQEEVNVVAHREVVDLENTAVQTKFSDEFIKDLPIPGRFYQNVLTLAPGVSDDDGDGNVAVRGSRVGDFKIMVGGVSNVDPLTGLAMNAINPDSIEEIEVVTAGAGVAYGRAQGGYSNVVQKQGGNEFEGSFNLIYRSSKLDGNGATNLTGERFPEFEAIQPAIALSGPILKDKLWWFLAYEYRNRQDPINTLSEVVVATTTQPNAFVNMTWQASPRNKISFQLTQDPQTSTNAGVSSTRRSENAVRTEIGGPTYRMQWTAPFSARLLVDSQVAYSDFHSNVLPMTSGVANDCAGGYDLISNSDCLNLDNGTRTGSFFRSERANSQRLTLDTRAEIYAGKLWGMNQNFKLGFTVENERYYREDNRQPQTNFEVVSDPSTSPGDPLQRIGIVTANFSVPQFDAARATGTTWGFFAEDQLTPRPNIKITLQARFEREQLNSEGVLPFNPQAEASKFIQVTAPPPLGQSLPVDGAIPNIFTSYENITSFLDQLAGILGVSADVVAAATAGLPRQSAGWLQRRRPGDIALVNDNFAPFLAVNWDPWSDGKTSFGFSAGRGYGFIPLNRPVLELAPGNAFVSFDAVPCGPGEPGCSSSGWKIPLNIDGVPSSLGGNGGINPAVNVTVIDRNLRTPYRDEFTFKVERELTAETQLRVTLIRKKERDLHQDIDINHVPGDYGRCVFQTDHTGPTIEPLPITAQNPTGGDGILDDCVGKLDRGPIVPTEGNRLQTFLNHPDGILDLYLQNPAWGQIFLVGNYNSADYKGITVELNRRRYRGWELNGSYTWSEAKSAADDYDSPLGDDATTLTDEYGYSGSDRRHEFKMQAATTVPGGVRVGTSISWQTGLPYSILTAQNSRDAIPPTFQGLGAPQGTRPRFVYPTHQRNDQRNEAYWTFDASVTKELSLRGGTSLSFTGNVFDMLNDPPVRTLGVTNGNAASVRNFGRRFQLGVAVSF